MYYCKIFIIYFNVFVSIHHSTGQRRIVDGKVITSDKKYMVFLIKSSESLHQYTGWLCGGAIVHPWYILTAAACLYNMEHVFVIAGMDYYVKAEELEMDYCAANTKRKIIRHCAPDTLGYDNKTIFSLMCLFLRALSKANIATFPLFKYRDAFGTREYNFENFDTTGKWFNLDIILGKVDKPYGVHDNEEFKKFACAYVPAKIGVNYNAEFQQQFRDVMALGWGTKAKYGEDKDTNSPFLNYIIGYLMEKEKCEKRLPKYFSKKTSVCFDERGSVDDRGKLQDFIEDCDELHNGCPSLSRRNDKDPNITYGYDSRRFASLPPENYRRFGGLCQNDHGGPLVGWVGGKEIIMGVASYFLVAKNMSCVGPSVFTSTACVNKFLYCKLEQDGARRSTWCKHHNDFADETDMPWT